MNVIIFTPEEIVSDFSGAELRVEITGTRRLEHIHKILKSHKGDSLRVGLLNGNMGRGIINKITAKSLSGKNML